MKSAVTNLANSNASAALDYPETCKDSVYSPGQSNFVVVEVVGFLLVQKNVLGVVGAV